MRCRHVLVFVLLLMLTSLDAVARDFSASVDRAGGLASGRGVRGVVHANRGRYEVTFQQGIGGCGLSVAVALDVARTEPSQISGTERQRREFRSGRDPHVGWRPRG